MSLFNYFAVFASADENETERTSVDETVSELTLNSNTHEPEKSSHSWLRQLYELSLCLGIWNFIPGGGDSATSASNLATPDDGFQTVVRKTRNPRLATTIKDDGDGVRRSPSISGPSERFPICVTRGDKENNPKSHSEKWTWEKSSEMRELKTESKARAAALKAHKQSIQSKGAQARRDRAAEMKVRKAEAKAHKDEVKARKDNIRKTENEKKEVEKGPAKERKLAKERTKYKKSTRQGNSEFCGAGIY